MFVKEWGTVVSLEAESQCCQFAGLLRKGGVVSSCIVELCTCVPLLNFFHISFNQYH